MAITPNIFGSTSRNHSHDGGAQMKIFIQKQRGGIQGYDVREKTLQRYSVIGRFRGQKLYGKYYRSLFSIIYEFKKHKTDSPEGLSIKTWTTGTQSTNQYMPRLRQKAKELADKWLYTLHYHGKLGNKKGRRKFKHYFETQGEETNEIISSIDNDAQSKIKYKVSLVQGQIDYKVFEEGENDL